jgi:hypothetical protein
MLYWPPTTQQVSAKKRADDDGGGFQHYIQCLVRPHGGMERTMQDLKSGSRTEKAHHVYHQPSC